MIKIETERLLLREPLISDASRIAALEAKNKAFWAPYASDTGPVDWVAKLQGFEEEARAGRAVRFLLFAKENPQGPVMGVCNFTQVFRGPFQACYLGYKLDQDFQGQGCMEEALRASIAYLFDVLNLHRIMANFIPSNHRSQRLLEKLGFEKEGYAKNYLLIDGRWQDHILMALTNAHWKSPTLFAKSHEFVQ
jgi:ribosomal-protein-alanine N-acetyltransferase